MKIYCISDIHGHLFELNEWITVLEQRGIFQDQNDKLIFLGDYIDRGRDSCGVLQTVYDLSLKYENVTVLRGNHEEWFLDWLDGKEEVWLAEDQNLSTSRTFLLKDQLEEIGEFVLQGKPAFEVYDLVRKMIKENHPEMIRWMKKMPRYYKTETQIFVHAGVDEEVGDLWEWGTADYIFTGKYPPQTGHFYMDIIAGHVSAEGIARQKNPHINHKGIYFDGESHYYIDGGVAKRSGQLLCLMYDEDEKKYYELMKDGTAVEIR